MTHTVKFNLITHRRFLLLFLLFTTLTGCYTQPSSAIQPEDGFLINQSTVIFFVSTPFNTAPDAEIYLDIVDEITGINLNPVRHKMQLVAEHLYSIELSFPDSSMIKYRYALGGSPVVSEYDVRGIPVRYRVVNTQQNNPVYARDVVASWMNNPLNISLGRAEGRLIDATTGTGIPDLLVNLNGLQTTTSATGEFRLDNVLPGKFLLTIHHMDGAYEPFQQEAIIAPDASTPVEVSLIPSPTTRVTFIVTPPLDHDRHAPVRLIGSIASLGNTFTEHPGGTSILAVNAPSLNPQSDGTYKITLSLPAGMDLRYKYSIGDGFWNAERLEDGQFITRQLIVPHEDVTITETIANWTTKDHTPIRIEARVLPDNDHPQQLYIQLNSYTWTDPMPMWLDKDNSAWLYEIYSPLYLFPSVGYRLCYDPQCNTVAAINGSGDTEGTRIPTDNSQSLIKITLPPIPDSSGEIPSPISALFSPHTNPMEAASNPYASFEYALCNQPSATQGRQAGFWMGFPLLHKELNSISVKLSDWFLEYL